MKRYLCWVAGLGVVALPDWASACRPGWGPPVCHAPAYPVYPVYPVCPPPVYVCPPPVYVCPPGPGYVVPVPHLATPSPAPPTGMGAIPPAAARPPAAAPPRPPAVEPVRPTAGSDGGVPPPPKADPPRSPKSDPTRTFPKVDIPKGLQLPPEPGAQDSGTRPPKEPDFRPVPVPKSAVPAAPSAAPPDSDTKLPPLRLPGEAAPKSPAGPAPPSAVPTAAPVAPDLAIPLPAVPDPKGPAALPSLTLPPDSPVRSPESTSRSSPLTGGGKGPKVSVFPASGTTAAGGYRSVGFYNHTGRELALTIEGKAVKLPAKSYLEAKLGPTFAWSHGDNAATQQAVPAGAAGLDIVFKE